MSKKYCRVWLGYFKEGDDLQGCIDDNKGNIIKGLCDHRDLLKSGAEHLNKLAKFFEKHPKYKVEIEAGTHHIGIVGSEECIGERTTRQVASWFSAPRLLIGSSPSFATVVPTAVLLLGFYPSKVLFMLRTSYPFVKEHLHKYYTIILKFFKVFYI